MPEKEKRPRARSSGRLSTINEHAAGLDVGSTFHVVAVRGDQDDQPVRTFRSFSGDLHQMADWLTSVGITTVAMESTGVYWIPVFEILEARGLEVLLVNARDVKNVPGRKTDVNDAQWLQQLRSFTSTDFFAEAFTPALSSLNCGPICVFESGWSNTRPPTYSICRRRSCR